MQRAGQLPAQAATLQSQSAGGGGGADDDAKAKDGLLHAELSSVLFAQTVEEILKLDASASCATDVGVQGWLELQKQRREAGAPHIRASDRR
jgi:hypothetical protein